MKAFEHTVTGKKPFEEAVLTIERKADFFPRAGIEAVAAEVESVVLKIIDEAR